MSTVAPGSGKGPRGIPDSSGSIVVPAPLKLIAEQITTKNTEFEGGLDSSEMHAVSSKLAACGQPSEFVNYKVYHLPMLSHRDYVFDVTWADGKTDDGKTTAIQTAISVDNPKFPTGIGGRVRGYVYCVYTLTEIDPSTTRVDILVNLDPMGSFPVWLAKMYAGAYPDLMLGRIKKQCVKMVKAA